MKKIFYKTILVSTFLLAYNTLWAQCELTEIQKKAEAKLGKMISIKTFKLDNSDAQHQEIEYSYVLGKDVEYLFSINSDKTDSPKIIITLYNSNKKPIATNYNEKSDHYSNTLIYKSSATKLYYITFKIKDETKCAACVLGFKAGNSKKLSAW